MSLSLSQVKANIVSQDVFSTTKQALLTRSEVRRAILNARVCLRTNFFAKAPKMIAPAGRSSKASVMAKEADVTFEFKPEATSMWTKTRME